MHQDALEEEEEDDEEPEKQANDDVDDDDKVHNHGDLRFSLSLLLSGKSTRVGSSSSPFGWKLPEEEDDRDVP